nr:type 4 pilus major pilin [Paraburkholderia mimosarum]
MFHTGIQNATQNDANFSGESLTSLAQNHAFDAAGARVASDYSTVQGMFGGDVTATPGTVTNANDAVITTYPVPAAVCSMSAAALSNVFTEVSINGTVVYSPTTAFSSSAAGSACSSAGQVATVELYTTRS